MMQVYQQDLGKSERAIKQVAEDLDTANRQADLLTRERDNAKAEVQSFNREISQLQEQIRSMSRKFQVDAQDSLMGHRKHLSGLENEWSNERHRLLTELSELKQAKIDLQLQVGYLLRQRESSEDEMGQLKRHFDLKRDQFKREVLGIN